MTFIKGTKMQSLLIKNTFNFKSLIMKNIYLACNMANNIDHLFSQ